MNGKKAALNIFFIVIFVTMRSSCIAVVEHFALRTNWPQGANRGKSVDWAETSFCKQLMNSA